MGLVPSGVGALVEAGHTVLVESGAGEKSTLTDDEYEEFGAEVVVSAADVWNRSDLIVKVKEPQPSEYEFLRPGPDPFYVPSSRAAAGTYGPTSHEASHSRGVRNDPGEGRLVASADTHERGRGPDGRSSRRSVP